MNVRRIHLALIPLLWLAAWHLDAQQGYTIRDNQLLVTTQSHWQAWDVATGVAFITAGGSVSPRFQRKEVNASLDAAEFAVQFQGGVVAGTHQEDAHHLIDGDLATSWGPDLDRPAEDWWVQIRLGPPGGGRQNRPALRRRGRGRTLPPIRRAGMAPSPAPDQNPLHLAGHEHFEILAALPHRSPH